MGFWGIFFWDFGGKDEFMGAKPHCGYCGTIENGQKMANFLGFFHTF